ncbi:MAG: hypothetical protein QOJ62_3121 [Actinomycetota bacterium]|jgi:AcrR family transcriptional regulator|nr:hypothetical protein [Actinomycetota bacterium]
MASVSRKTSTTRAERRADTARRLGEAAQELIAAGESVTRLSVDKLCTRAGIARSTFYAHFADKGELLRDLFTEVLGDLHSANEHWWTLGPVTQPELRSALTQLVRRYQPNRHLVAAAFDLSSYDAATRDLVHQAMDRSIAELAEHIERGQHEGWIDPDLLPHQTAGWLIWTIERGQRQILDLASPTWNDDIDGYLQMIWNALYRFANRPAELPG